MHFQDNTAWRRGLRREMIARREALSPADHRALSEAIVAHLVSALPELSRGIVGFCWPIKHEPDVRAAIEHWRHLGGRAALPVVVAEATPLAFRAWTSEDPLAPDRYGIPTPTMGDWVHPTALLLPLNAFDGAGYRLGYGGGYFDRTLAAMRPRPLAIGVGFEMNRVDSIRPEAHDQPLDWIVTEAGAFPLSGSRDAGAGPASPKPATGRPGR